MILSAFFPPRKLDTSGLSEGVQKAAAAINDLAGSASRRGAALDTTARIVTAAGADTAAAALDSFYKAVRLVMAEKMEAVAESPM